LHALHIERARRIGGSSRRHPAAGELEAEEAVNFGDFVGPAPGFALIGGKPQETIEAWGDIGGLARNAMNALGAD
jgi:hypothetical protein